MTVFIHERDCYGKIAKVEGPLWVRDEAHYMGLAAETGRLLSNYSFAGAILQWHYNETAVIYGLGGFHRYFIREDGRVVFSKHHCSDPKREAFAAEVGFDVE